MQQKALALALSAIWATNSFAAEQTAENTNTLPEVKVSAQAEDSAPKPSEKTKSYSVKSTETATRLNTSLKETPQSISVITREQIDDFKLTSVNDLLDMATGIKVERVETDRTYYSARGSDITNFQIDGIGVPFQTGLMIGDMDTAIYDRIEVLRGANGLLTSTGNPSATINFIRKRPTEEFQAKLSVTAGSWDKRRVEADVSGSLNEAGNVRGRIVLANQNRNSYLDRNSQERNLAYGIIEADITEKTTVTLGHTYQQNDTNAPTWGALPLRYADGSPRTYSRSTTPSPDWTYWNNQTNITFAELTHSFNNGWKIKTQLSSKREVGNTKLFYLDGYESRTTGTGLIYYAGRYRDTFKEYIADIYASGPFNLAGREHELVIGTSWSRANVHSIGNVTSSTLSSFNDSATFEQPDWTSWNNYGSRTQKRLNSYTAAKFNVTDKLKVTTGASMLTYKYDGIYYFADNSAEAHNKVTPYVGAVFNLTDQHSLYASYTGIYNPQTAIDKNKSILPPLKGKNYEAGFKSELANNLNFSFALFKSVQENLAQSTNTYDENGALINEAINATTKGYEFDLSGEVNDRLKVSSGYTRLMSVKGDNDQNVKPYTPRNMVKLSATYRVPNIEKLKVGASVNWQDDVHYVYNDGASVKQDSYALINLMANYELNKHWSAALNVYNLTNEKYLSSLMTGQSYYGAPMNASATLTWQY
ncbi:TonB-dependent siderophore receptor [Methylovorus sp. MP688]|uniref:TonB-dependent siderophore receptor n=1 Tax=Methylovorus sp. (strain MP688) TaxID=887061 RepID=UPI0001EC43FD|nr:TonB-dependent siderophore receptor [Methylovorus sp. MP688]ADQ83638.1 TonB-dependent siderophore receptor [Methylovorus sp. MP688]